MIVIWPGFFILFFRKQYNAFAFWPFIFLRNRTLQDNQKLMRHERIHFKQQIELLLVFFYLVYTIEFLVRYIKHRNWDKAYRAISFEREAYNHQHDEEYLHGRKLFSMWRKFDQ